MTSWIALLSVAALASGCAGGGAGANEGTQPGAGASQSEAPASAPTVKVMFDYNVDTKGMSLEDNEYVDYILEKTGVRVALNSPGTAGYLDKLNILMASGDFPDAFMIEHKNIGTLQKYMADGMIEDLTPYLDAFPNLKSQMPEDAWTPVTVDGSIFAIPYNRQDSFNQVVYIRKPWLDALGLDIPRTIDEFYEVMKAFTEQDPDGNGADDTFGLLAMNDMFYGGRMFQAAFDAETYKVVDGEVLPPVLTEEYREYLAFMNKLTSEGILDPEWPTTTGAIFRQKIGTGKYGMFNNFWHFPGQTEIAEEIRSEYIAVPLPLGPDGNPSSFAYTTTNRHYIAIPTGAKNIEPLLKVLDWAVTEEGTKFHYMGIEGKHYVETANGFEKGPETRAPLHWAFSMVKHGQLNDEIKKYMLTDYDADVVDNLSLATDMGRLDAIAASLPYYPELAAYNLPNITDEFMAKAIFGNADLQAGWDEYVKKYRASGGDKAIQLWTEWYEQSGLK